MTKKNFLHQKNGARHQRGLSVSELMIALGLGALIVSMAASVFLASRQAYLLHDESIQLHDNGRYALDAVSRAIHHIGRSAKEVSGGVADHDSMIRGFDHHSLNSTSAAVQQPLPKSVNGSDILALRIANRAADSLGEDAVVNCAGFTTDQPAVWSIFYVAVDHTGEAELYCKYQGKHAWATAAIARGVESFQVLYGLSDQAGAPPVRYLTATQIDQLDQQTNQSIPQVGSAVPQSNWNAISEIRIGLLLHGSQPLRIDGLLLQHDLFGPLYADQYGVSDPGSRVDEAKLPAKVRNRLRRLFTSTIRLPATVQELPA